MHAQASAQGVLQQPPEKTFVSKEIDRVLWGISALALSLLAGILIASTQRQADITPIGTSTWLFGGGGLASPLLLARLAAGSAQDLNCCRSMAFTVVSLIAVRLWWAPRLLAPSADSASSGSMVQPSEFAKLAAILLLAGWCSAAFRSNDRSTCCGLPG